MFDRDQPIIAKWAQQSPDNFAKLCQFVILTVQTSLENVPADIETAAQGGDEAMGVLYGWKFQAYNYVWEHRETLATQCYFEAAHAKSDRDLARAIIEILANVHGFGLVKAGFVAQLAFGVGGCLDTHNLRRFDLKASSFSKYKTLKTVKARARKLEAYLDACEAQGGCEALWNGWCAYVADRRPKFYTGGAQQVSALHVEALNIK